MGTSNAEGFIATNGHVTDLLYLWAAALQGTFFSEGSTFTHPMAELSLRVVPVISCSSCTFYSVLSGKDFKAIKEPSALPQATTANEQGDEQRSGFEATPVH